MYSIKCVFYMCTVVAMTMYSFSSDYLFELCTRCTVNMYCSCMLRVQLLCILDLCFGYSEYVFYLCTEGVGTM